MDALENGVGAAGDAESQSGSPAGGSSRELRLVEVKDLAGATSIPKG